MNTNHYPQKLAWGVLLSAFFAFEGIHSAWATETSGSGVVISPLGDILTVAHVVDECSSITVQLPLQVPSEAKLIYRDKANDLALIRSKTPSRDFVTIRSAASPQVGETVTAVGYPLTGLLSSQPIVTTGVISATAGLGDDVRDFQITAPVQPGNSGGPLLDSDGHLIGLVAAKLSYRVVGFTGALPENVNFAVKSNMATIFLDAIGAHYQTAPSVHSLSISQISTASERFTVHIVCVAGQQISNSLSASRKVGTRPVTKRENWTNKIQSNWFSH